MSDQDELRDRLTKVVHRLDEERYKATGEPSQADEIAQAIIDEFGMAVEERLTEFGIDDPGYQQRVIGEWEEK